MPRQTRPAGPSWPVDDEWKRGVRAKMRSAGLSPAELARRLGCTDSALTVLWRKETRQSRLVAGIHRELELPPPARDAGHDDAMRRVRNRWAVLNEAQRELVARIVEELAGS